MTHPADLSQSAEEITRRDAAKLAAYERLARLNEPPLAGMIGVPVIGTMLGQGLRILFGRSLFVTSVEDAKSGVSNMRLVWTTVLALGVLAFIGAILSLYSSLVAELPEGRIWIAQAAVAVFVILGLPYLIEALGLWLGTALHAGGGAKNSLHARMNRFHKPVRNIFTPRR